jgi:UDPglucose 6-dehydrogenase
VLVRTDRGTQLVQLADLHRDTATSKGMPDDTPLLEPSGLEVLAWDGGLPAWYAVSAITRLSGTGRMVEVQTGMGRRVQCTDDHPFVVVDPDSGATRVVLARDLDRACWLPLAGDAPAAPARATPMLSVVEYAGPDEGSVFVRVPDEPVEMADAAQLTVREVALARSRATRERFEELEGLGVAGSGITPVAALTNVADVPIEIAADEAFWRVVGLYLAGGRIAADGGRRRLSWSFSPTGERSLADEVRDYLAVLGVRASARRLAASTEVSVSSHLLAGLFDALGLGRGSHDHAIPGLIFAWPEPERRALLAGLWRGQGTWSYVGGEGASVVLEFGTVSRELADGVLRLLSSIGITAGLKVGRAGKATCDTFWIRIAGAGQIAQVLDFVRPDDRETIRASIAAQPDTALPTGYRPRGGDALVRVTRVDEVPFAGPVYSLEVPGPHTFVTTHGLVVHNCFPKDVRALKQLAGNTGYHFQLLTAVIEVNELQKRRVIAKLQTHLGDLRGRRVALLGIAFKPNTDDVREASSLVLSSRLVAEGAEVRAYDPIAAGTQLTQVGARVCATVAEALEGADAAVIVTEWNEFRAVLDPNLRDLMARPLLIDGRNLLDPGEAARAGFEYDSIGRPRRAPVTP